MLQITDAGRKLIRAALALSLHQRQKPVTLAGPQPRGPAVKKRKLNRDRFERFVRNTVLILKTWESSPFEFEAACLHGLRSHLCGEGWPWRDADQAAAAVVEEGLRRIRAVRPRWAEGQIDFALETPVDRLNCVNCGSRIPEERKENGERLNRSVKYCSDRCNVYAIRRRHRIAHDQQTMAEWLAACSAKSQRRLDELARDCPTCGTRFLPRDRTRKYCSSGCAVRATTKRQEIACNGCGKRFIPKKVRQTCCSAECGFVAQRRRWAARSQFQCEEVTT